MRIVQIGGVGNERPGVLVDDEHYVDVSDITATIDGQFLARGGLGLLDAVVSERVAAAEVHALAGARLGAPIARPHQILCIGLNYGDHAQETSQPIPDEPILFTKAPNTLIGPYDDVQIPRTSTKTDYEIELGVVIGRRTHYLGRAADARACIAGYVLVNDISEREFQMERGGQWTKGKSCATFNPCGPYLVTPDEIGDPHCLDMWLNVNGQRRQTGNTSTMLFDVMYLVHYLSQFMILEPGDLINTGTPPGVGMSKRPPRYLQKGDTMELTITGLGTQRQKLVDAERAPDLSLEPPPTKVELGS